MFEHVEYLKAPTKNIRIETEAADCYKSEYKIYGGIFIRSETKEKFTISKKL